MQHKELSNGKWFEMSLCEQLANVGAEVGRAINWKNRNVKNSRLAAERALELMWLTIDDRKNIKRLKELARVYECLADFFYGENIYKSTDEIWNRYFYGYAYAVRMNSK